MIRAWLELLPLFVTRWLAQRYCERLPLGDRVIVNPRPGVFFDAGPEVRASTWPIYGAIGSDAEALAKWCDGRANDDECGPHWQWQFRKIAACLRAPTGVRAAAALGGDEGRQG